MIQTKKPQRRFSLRFLFARLRARLTQPPWCLSHAHTRWARCHPRWSPRCFSHQGWGGLTVVHAVFSPAALSLDWCDWCRCEHHRRSDGMYLVYAQSHETSNRVTASLGPYCTGHPGMCRSYAGTCSCGAYHLHWRRIDRSTDTVGAEFSPRLEDSTEWWWFCDCRDCFWFSRQQSSIDPYPFSLHEGSFPDQHTVLRGFLHPNLRNRPLRIGGSCGRMSDRVHPTFHRRLRFPGVWAQTLLWLLSIHRNTPVFPRPSICFRLACFALWLWANFRKAIRSRYGCLVQPICGCLCHHWASTSAPGKQISDSQILWSGVGNVWLTHPHLFPFYTRRRSLEGCMYQFRYDQWFARYCLR